MGAPGNDSDSTNPDEGSGRGFEPRALFAVGDRERARIVKQMSERELRRAFDQIAKEKLPDDFAELLRRIDQSGNC